MQILRRSDRITNDDEKKVFSFGRHFAAIAQSIPPSQPPQILKENDEIFRDGQGGWEGFSIRICFNIFAYNL